MVGHSGIQGRHWLAEGVVLWCSMALSDLVCKPIKPIMCGM